MQFVWKIQHTHNDNSNYLVWSFLRLWCFDPRPLRFWCAALVAHRAHRSWHNVVRWYGAVNAPKIVKERHIIGAIWVDCLDGTSVLWATTEVSTTLLAPKRQDMITNLIRFCHCLASYLAKRMQTVSTKMMGPLAANSERHHTSFHQSANRNRSMSNCIAPRTML